MINYRPLWFALALGSSILELSKVYNINIALVGFIFTNLHTKAHGHWPHLSREDAFLWTTLQRPDGYDVLNLNSSRKSKIKEGVIVLVYVLGQSSVPCLTLL